MNEKGKKNEKCMRRKYMKNIIKENKEEGNRLVNAVKVRRRKEKQDRGTNFWGQI